MAMLNNQMVVVTAGYTPKSRERTEVVTSVQGVTDWPCRMMNVILLPLI